MYRLAFIERFGHWKKKRREKIPINLINLINYFKISHHLSWPGKLGQVCC